MRKLKTLLCVLTAAAFITPVWAKNVTVNVGGSPITLDLPDEIANYVDQNRSSVEAQIANSGISASDLENTIAPKVRDAYSSLSSSLGTTTPYTTVKEGLNDFSKVLIDVFPNTQIQGNVWANAWIGTLLPKPHFGFGINAGAAMMDVTPLIKIADALNIGASGLPSTLVMPTVTADFRVGGFILPFDVGFVISGIDTTALGLDSTIKPVNFDYFSIGFDVRYAVLQSQRFDSKLSVGAGFYYTKGSVGINDSDHATAGLDFQSGTLSLNAQASAKFLFFTPYLGTRIMMTASKVDWYVKDIKWSNIIGSQNGQIAQAQSAGLLPTNFSGGDECNIFQHIRPVIYGGFSFDIVVIDLTFNVSYDFISNIPAGSFSICFSL